MKHKKDFYRKLNYDGYSWWGFVDGFHNFKKGNATEGWYNIRCTEEDIENNNIADMVKFGVTK